LCVFGMGNMEMVPARESRAGGRIAAVLLMMLVREPNWKGVTRPCTWAARGLGAQCAPGGRPEMAGLRPVAG
jgi:hypothetical protein